MTGIEVLDKLIDEVNEKRNELYDRIGYMREHNFPHEAEYLEAKKDTYCEVLRIIRDIRRQCDE